VIKLKIGENYMENLRERLTKYDVSQGELARQMDIAPAQVSRWFNHVNEASGKPMQPSLESVYAIEEALIEILQNRRKKPRNRKRGDS
jgi:transcriptional regulator with XRE-family HTH domain